MQNQLRKLQAFNKRRPTTYLVLALVVPPLLFWGIWFFGNSKAFGAERICRPGHQIDCLTAKQYAKLFKDGHYKKSSGIPAKKVFKHPMEARRAFIHKLDRYFKNHPKKKRQVRRHVQQSRSGSLNCPSDMGDWVCEIYKEIVFKATCVSQAGGPSTAPDVCYIFDRLRAPISTKDIVRGGAVVSCLGAVAIGVGGSVATKGRSLFIASWGVQSCGWSLWGSFL